MYDVMPNLSSANKVLSDWIGAGGAFHSGVVLHHPEGAREWAYGGCESGTGVFNTMPQSEHLPFKYKQTISMGQTELSSEEVIALLLAMMEEWHGDGYDLTKRNCCHFSEALCIALDVPEAFPGWVNRLAHAGAAIGDAHTAALTKASEIDESYRITETVGATVHAASGTLASLDERYRVSETAGKGLAAAGTL